MNISKETTFLAIGAHPDDAELGCGGLLAKLASRGHRIGILDLTRGEMGSSGDAEVRLREAREAADILGVSFRENLDLGDCHLVDSINNRKKLAVFFRKIKPRMVATCFLGDRHPDHFAAARLVQGASLLARLKKMQLDGDIHSIEKIFYYSIHDQGSSSFIVDISKHFETKKKALEAYRSQFVKPEQNDVYKYIGVSDYIRTFTARAVALGSLIGTDYAESFITDAPIRIDHPETVLLP